MTNQDFSGLIMRPASLLVWIGDDDDDDDDDNDDDDDDSDDLWSNNILWPVLIQIIIRHLSILVWIFGIAAEMFSEKKNASLVGPILVFAVPTGWDTTAKRRASFAESKVHVAHMGPTGVLSAPGGPHVGPMNLAIRVYFLSAVIIFRIHIS